MSHDRWAQWAGLCLPPLSPGHGDKCFIRWLGPSIRQRCERYWGPGSQLSLVTISLSLSSCHTLHSAVPTSSCLGMIVRLSSYLPGLWLHIPGILYSALQPASGVSTYWVFKAWQKTQIKMSILLPWGGIFSRATAIKCNCWFILPTVG